MGFSLKKLVKTVTSSPLVRGPAIVDPFNPKSVVAKVNRSIDKTVGGAKGWATVTKAAAPAANLIPVYGPAISAGLAASSVVLSGEAQRQAAKKAQREYDAQLAAYNAAQEPAAEPSAPATVTPTAGPAGSALPSSAPTIQPSGTPGPAPLTFGRWLRSLIGG